MHLMQRLNYPNSTPCLLLNLDCFIYNNSVLFTASILETLQYKNAKLKFGYINNIANASSTVILQSYS